MMYERNGDSQNRSLKVHMIKGGIEKEFTRNIGQNYKNEKKRIFQLNTMITIEICDPHHKHIFSNTKRGR